MRNIKQIIVHCSDTTATATYVDKIEIEKWHIEKEKWPRIGYHYVITRSAVLQSTYGHETPGIHAAGHNYNSIGICMVGGRDKKGNAEDNFTAEQYNVLYSLLTELKLKYPGVKIIGHYNVNPNKKCPSFNVQAWLKEVGLD